MLDGKSTVKQRKQNGESHRDDDLMLFQRSPDVKPRLLPFTEWNWDAYVFRSSNRSVCFWVSVTIVTINIFFASPVLTSLDNRSRRTSREGDVRSFFKEPDMIVFSVTGPDYGNLKLKKRHNFDFPIDIDPFDYEMAKYYRQHILRTTGANASATSKNDPESDRIDKVMPCRRVSWTGYSFPSCNQLHETILIDRVFDNHGRHQPYNVSYLNEGSFRQAWRFKRNEDHVVAKRMRMWEDIEWGAEQYYQVHKEAIRLERLLPSPKVVNIYGHCGTTVLSEALALDVEDVIVPGSGEISQDKLDKLDDVYPQNNLTNSEKLQISLDMAEALAALHGFEGGCMTLGDTHIEEWLIAPDGTVKLNDLNLAKEPEWNEFVGQYCNYHSTYHKTHRSPEEYTGDAQDESVDTYAYGNMIYVIVTGLWPFYHERATDIRSEEIQSMIVKGMRPYVDPRYRTRSFIEGKLVEVMKKCWAQDRTQRPSMFYIVSFLRDVKREAVERGELQESKLIKITL